MERVGNSYRTFNPFFCVRDANADAVVRRESADIDRQIGLKDPAAGFERYRRLRDAATVGRKVSEP